MSENEKTGDETKSLEKTHEENLAAYEEKLEATNALAASATVENLGELQSALAELDELKEAIDATEAAEAALASAKAVLEGLAEGEGDEEVEGGEDTSEEEAKASEEAEAKAKEDAEAKAKEAETLDTDEGEKETAKDESAEDVKDAGEIKETNEDATEASVNESDEALSADKVAKTEVEEFSILSPHLDYQNGFKSQDEFIKNAFEATRKVNAGSDGEVIYLGRIVNEEYDVKLTQDAGQNLKAISRSNDLYSRDAEALNASICACQSFDVLRDIPSYCNVSTGLFSLPKVQAPRGGLTWQLSAAACEFEQEIFEWKEVCDPEAPAQPDKVCNEIPCGSEESMMVSAFGWCYTYSNGFGRFNPEQLSYWLGEALCRFERDAADRLLQLVLTHPVFDDGPKTCAAKYGNAFRDISEILSIRARLIRQKLCAGNLRLTWVLPSWLQDALTLNASGELSAIASANNLDIQFVDHYQELDPDVDECEYPDTFEYLLYPAGAFREADGGELNFGLVRDSQLNAQNKVKLQYERWNGVGLFAPECAVEKGEITGLCYEGATPAVAASACAA